MHIASHASAGAETRFCSSAASGSANVGVSSIINREDRIIEEAAREVFPRYFSNIPVTTIISYCANATANNARPSVSEEQDRLNAILEEALNEFFGLPNSFHSTDHSI